MQTVVAAVEQIAVVEQIVVVEQIAAEQDWTEQTAD